MLAEVHSEVISVPWSPRGYEQHGAAAHAGGDPRRATAAGTALLRVGELTVINLTTGSLLT